MPKLHLGLKNTDEWVLFIKVMINKSKVIISSRSYCPSKVMFTARFSGTNKHLRQAITGSIAMPKRVTSLGSVSGIWPQCKAVCALYGSISFRYVPLDFQVYQIVLRTCANMRLQLSHVVKRHSHRLSLNICAWLMQQLQHGICADEAWSQQSEFEARQTEADHSWDEVYWTVKACQTAEDNRTTDESLKMEFNFETFEQSVEDTRLGIVRHCGTQQCSSQRARCILITVCFTWHDEFDTQSHLKFSYNVAISCLSKLFNLHS